MGLEQSQTTSKEKGAQISPDFNVFIIKMPYSETSPTQITVIVAHVIASLE